MRRGYLHSSLLSVLLLSATPAFSQNAEQAQLQMQNDAKAKNWQLTPGEIDVFQRAKTSVEDAIAVAQPHGKVMDVTFRVQHGTPVYQVKAVQNNEVWEATINAGTGISIGPGKTIPEDQLDSEDKAEVQAIQKAQTTLAEAVRSAVAHSRATAINARLRHSNGNAVYEVQVLHFGSSQTVKVNPENGRVIAAG
jgi:uncharacterized membrane protein YkoI